MLVLRILIWFAPIIAVALPANPLNDADVSEVYTEGEIADPAIGLTPSEREQAELLEEFLKDSSELVSRDDVGDDDDDQLSAPGDEDDPETVKKLAGPLPAALGLLACRTNINVYFVGSGCLMGGPICDPGEPFAGVLQADARKPTIELCRSLGTGSRRRTIHPCSATMATSEMRTSPML